ncbi:hypothetical protein AC578_4097 [Pseudocercospora eumusae]|uniref:Uncharacterized protein n=1 Tax=Pseudocercospora eumusae TaxID=321146 RepID=A0A139HDN0_9PEZI|nr:hypothetical protein AC578_4097 [Pseudocercospora eumusae]
MNIKLPKDADDYCFNFHSVQQARGHVSIAPEPGRDDEASETEARRDEGCVHCLMRAIQSKNRAVALDYTADVDQWARFQAHDQKRVESWIEKSGSKEFERRAWLVLGLIREVHTQGAPAEMMKQYLDDITHTVYLIVGFEERMDRIAHPSIAWDFLSHHEHAENSEAIRHIALMLHSWVPKINERWTEFRERSVPSHDDASPLQKSKANDTLQLGREAVGRDQKLSGEVKIEEDDLIDLDSTPSETCSAFKAATLRQTPKADPLGPAGDIDMARVASQKKKTSSSCCILEGQTDVLVATTQRVPYRNTYQEETTHGSRGFGCWEGQHLAPKRCFSSERRHATKRYHSERQVLREKPARKIQHSQQPWGKSSRTTSEILRDTRRASGARPASLVQAAESLLNCIG